MTGADFVLKFGGFIGCGFALVVLLWMRRNREDGGWRVVLIGGLLITVAGVIGTALNEAALEENRPKPILLHGGDTPPALESSEPSDVEPEVSTLDQNTAALESYIEQLQEAINGSELGDDLDNIDATIVVNGSIEDNHKNLDSDVPPHHGPAAVVYITFNYTGANLGVARYNLDQNPSRVKDQCESEVFVGMNAFGIDLPKIVEYTWRNASYEDSINYTCLQTAGGDSDSYTYTSETVFSDTVPITAPIQQPTPTKSTSGGFDPEKFYDEDLLEEYAGCDVVPGQDGVPRWAGEDCAHAGESV